MTTRGEMPRYWRPEADELARRTLWVAHAAPLEAWQGVVHAMAGSQSADDRSLAALVTDFVQTMPVQRDRSDMGRIDRNKGGRRRTPLHERGVRYAARSETQRELFPDDPDARVER